MGHLLFSVILFASLPARAETGVQASTQPFVPPYCSAEMHRDRTQELLSLFTNDGNDRDPLEGRTALKGNMQDVIRTVTENDFKRRVRVAEIFAEGCIQSADDYYEAATVYQHGIIPDHHFMAYVWASRAAELGDKRARWLKAEALDRYLVDLGYKQVYATQAKTVGDDPASCWCLWPVQEGVSDEVRLKAGAKTLAQQMTWLQETNKTTRDKSCPTTFCPKEAKPVSKDSLPGVSW